MCASISSAVKQNRQIWATYNASKILWKTCGWHENNWKHSQLESIVCVECENNLSTQFCLMRKSNIIGSCSLAIIISFFNRRGVFACFMHWIFVNWHVGCSLYSLSNMSFGGKLKWIGLKMDLCFSFDRNDIDDSIALSFLVSCAYLFSTHARTCILKLHFSPIRWYGILCFT